MRHLYCTLCYLPRLHLRGLLSWFPAWTDVPCDLSIFLKNCLLPNLLLSSVCRHFGYLLILTPHTLFWRAVVNLYSSSSPSVFLAFLCSNAIVIVSSASHFVTSFLLVFVTFLSAFTILRMPSNSSSGSLSDNRSRHEKVMVTSAVGSRKRWNPSYRTSPFCYTHYAIDLVQGGILG